MDVRVTQAARAVRRRYRFEGATDGSSRSQTVGR